MPFTLTSTLRCTLQLNDRSVEISGTELATLRENLPDTGLDPTVTLSKETFRAMFEAGMILPPGFSPIQETAYPAEKLLSLRLSPYLVLAPTFTQGDIYVEPAIAMFVHPEFVETAAQFTLVLRKALMRAAETCAVRGIAFPQLQGLALAHQIAWQWFEAHPALRQWLVWNRDNQGRMSLALQNPDELVTTLSYPTMWLTVAEGKRPSQLRQIPVPLRDLPCLSRVLDILRGDESSPTLEADLTVVSVRRVLTAIEAVGGFIASNKAPAIYTTSSSQSTALIATHMGHACLIVDTGKHRLLFDPWLFPWDDQFEQQPLTSSQLGSIDAIFFTHHHEDHLHTGSLLTLPHHVPVFVPCEMGHPLEPRLTAFLRHLGFQDVRPLPTGDSYTLADGTEVEAVPFFGEGKNLLGFGANCYLVSHHGRNLLVHADASPDSEGRSIISTNSLQEIVARRGPIEVIWGTWWQERRFVFDLAPLAIFSPQISPDMWLNATESCDCPSEFLCDLARVAGAKLFLFYAESGPEGFLPPTSMQPYIPAVSFLWTRMEQVRDILRTVTGVEAIHSHPYMRVIIPADGTPYIDATDVAASRQRS